MGVSVVVVAGGEAAGRRDHGTATEGGRVRQGMIACGGHRGVVVVVVVVVGGEDGEVDEVSESGGEVGDADAGDRG
jgi:hypothetical protein